MLLPQTAEYALRAVLHIAARHPEPVRAGELAAGVGAPSNYLTKTLNQLARSGVLVSARGPRGGFRLAVAPDELTLGRVVTPFVGAKPRRCLLGHGVCGETPSCAVHARWAPVACEVDAFFASTTVADLIAPSAALAHAGGHAPSPAEPVPLHIPSRFP